MSLTIDRVLNDCVDLDAMTAFWCEAHTGVSWVVMADPEGYESCVLRSLDRKANEQADRGD